MIRTATAAAACAAASLLLCLAGCGEALAQGAGTVTHLAGILSVVKPDGQKKLLGVQSAVAAGDVLTTEAETYARLKFADGSEVVMRPASQLRVDEFRYNENKPETSNMVVSMLRGGLRAITGLIGKARPDNVRFNTVTATIGIRGTHLGFFLCETCTGMTNNAGQPLEDGLHVDVAEGAVVVSNRAGTMVVGAGQFGYVRDATTPPILVPQGAGYKIVFPSGITRNDTAGRSIGPNHDADCSAQ